jgi:hypothetical protein
MCSMNGRLGWAPCRESQAALKFILELNIWHFSKFFQSTFNLSQSQRSKMHALAGVHSKVLCVQLTRLGWAPCRESQAVPISNCALNFGQLLIAIATISAHGSLLHTRPQRTTHGGFTPSNHGAPLQPNLYAHSRVRHHFDLKRHFLFDTYTYTMH